MRQLGWSVDGNLRIDYRWGAGDAWLFCLLPSGGFAASFRSGTPHIRLVPRWYPEPFPGAILLLQVLDLFGSPGRIRTIDQPVNSRLLYR